MKMTAKEKIAREICWAGFGAPDYVGKTKFQYWRDLPEGRREVYRMEAATFLKVLKRIAPNLGAYIERS